MWIKVLRSKIHRATVTEKNLNYSGSITIDPDLLEKVGLVAGQCVLVANVNNGTRHETYIQIGKRGTGQVRLNGAAARLGELGDLVIVMGYAYMTPEEAAGHEPRIALVDEKNAFVKYI
ncbi:MAG TPA: aspartate 1-decarboxylase [Phycisphaerae bacterium]|nr:aspartate 1-decarboxylase [Phycisphaerae bacterium]HOI55400.1 aspartate 1-decarboxylase [Phycisphaerae bacterium]